MELYFDAVGMPFSCLQKYKGVRLGKLTWNLKTIGFVVENRLPKGPCSGSMLSFPGVHVWALLGHLRAAQDARRTLRPGWPPSGWLNDRGVPHATTGRNKSGKHRTRTTHHLRTHSHPKPFHRYSLPDRIESRTRRKLPVKPACFGD